MRETKLESMADFFDARSSIYEEVHLSHLKGGTESKRSLAMALPEKTKTLLDLGIGTGLELEEIYQRHPEIDITGLDVSANMLAILKEKYPISKLTLLNISYFDYDFSAAKFDAVISSMTMHHYQPSAKIDLYKRILSALTDQGVYVENDYILSEIDLPEASDYEQQLFAEYERLKSEQALSSEEDYHFDTPCTLKHQVELLLAAGFRDVRLSWQREHNITLIAYV
ncbi:class I SAM-dependent methyltransferase [Enterococcus sp. AZ109]|uniref:class I SAM-dependent methyltransferase n=1 Tax=Enterococcus sp. AZ109 TaxID=2774634 RepID=UPI003F205A28